MRPAAAHTAAVSAAVMMWLCKTPVRPIVRNVHFCPPVSGRLPRAVSVEKKSCHTGLKMINIGHFYGCKKSICKHCICAKLQKVFFGLCCVDIRQSYIDRKRGEFCKGVQIFLGGCILDFLGKFFCRFTVNRKVIFISPDAWRNCKPLYKTGSDFREYTGSAFHISFVS